MKLEYPKQIDNNITEIFDEFMKKISKEFDEYCKYKSENRQTGTDALYNL